MVLLTALLLALAAQAQDDLYLPRFPLGGGRFGPVRLERVHVMPPGGTAIVVDADGERRVRPSLRLFEGAPVNEPGHVRLALTRRWFSGEVATAAGRTRFASKGAPVSRHHLRSAEQPGTCTVLDARSVSGSVIGSSTGSERPPTGSPQRVTADVFLEVSPELRATFASDQDAIDYVLLLMAASSSIYQRDVGLELRVPSGYLRVWNVQPPWASPGFFDNLYGLRMHWLSPENALRGLPRATVQYLMLRTGLGGGVFKRGACQDDTAYGIQALDGFFPFPVEHTSPDNWDLFLMSHELGHIFGTVHTFQYQPPIPCNDGSGPDGGTIMGACNLDPGIGGLGLRFHPRVQTVLRRALPKFPCLERRPLSMGDWNADGCLDALDLAAFERFRGLGFEAAGALDVFDLDGDGELTARDRQLLEDVLDR